MKISNDHIVCIFKASNYWPNDTIALMYKRMEEVVGECQRITHRDEEKAQWMKEAILTMQGSWLTQHKYAYDITDSTHSEDVNKRLYSIRTLKDGTMRFASRKEILTNRTMYLIGLQALNTEHKFMGWAVYKTKTLPAQIQIKGAIVDCLLLKCKSTEDEQIVKQYFAKQWLPHGEPFAKVKRIRDTSHIKLKEHRVQMIASSWKPNYEAVENGSPRFNSETYGNWHINPRFKI